MLDRYVDVRLEKAFDAPFEGFDKEEALLAAPFFSMQKSSYLTPCGYKDDFGLSVDEIFSISVVSARHSAATIWDKDLLIYVFSVINHHVEHNLSITNEVVVPVHSFLRATRRSTGKRSYELLNNTLDRLCGTVIRATTRSLDREKCRQFSWIERVDRTYVDGGSLAYRVRLPENLFQAIVKDRSVVEINPYYFSLNKSLERRLYELALKMTSVFRLAEWTVDIKRLAGYCGVNSTTRKLKLNLIRISENDRLPDFAIELTPDLRSTKFIHYAHTNTSVRYKPQTKIRFIRK